MNKQTNLLDLDRPSLEAFFINMDEKPFHAAQILKWMHHHGLLDIDCMTNLSLDLRERLPEVAHISIPKIISEQISSDGTRKWVIELDDGNCIETVFIPEVDRGTLCVSSQAGCPLDCSFCATGKQGFNRNLTVSEIIGQVWLANKSLGHFDNRHRIISNIVMMGMGEPLLNFENVVTAMNLMMDDLAYGLSRKRVTLSTSGIVPGIKKLGQISNVSLAVSLHAANNELRNTLVPLNRKYPIEKLLAACMDYSRMQAGTPVTFEYVMLAGINDSESEAKTLSTLLKGWPAKVNLIPFNPFPNTEYKSSTLETIDRFRNILVNSGIITITRKTRGEDIDAACGQLTGKINPRSNKYQIRTIENIV